MSHTHVITDSDLHFIIDPITRTIESQSDNRYLTQLDHESAKLTFGIPLLVEGHDMSKCDRIEIHFTNITKKKDAQSNGVYIVKDSDKEITNNTFLFGWLVRRESTIHAGRLNFSITFLCHDEESNITYEWGTTECKYMQVLPKLEHTETIMGSYPDMYEQLKQELIDEYQVDENDINAAVEKCLVANPVKPIVSWDNMEDKPFDENEEGVVKQLDEKFIPDSVKTHDWNTLKNKPFYEEHNIEWLEQNVTVPGSGSTYNGLYFTNNEYDRQSLKNATILVVWDGVEYTCVTNSEKGYLGNKYIKTALTADQTGEPFYIEINYSTGVWNVYSQRKYDSHKLSIAVKSVDFRQIEEKFIPDSIARKSDIPEGLEPTEHTHSWNDLEDKPFGENEEGKVQYLDEKYIPDTIARKSDLENIPSGPGGSVDTVTDEEVLDMLFELDTINTVTDESGYILTDENDNILLW